MLQFLIWKRNIEFRKIKFIFPDSPSFNVENSPTNHPACSSTSNATYNRNLDNQLKTRRKVAKMLIAVVTMFAINFFPVHFIPIFQVSDC